MDDFSKHLYVINAKALITTWGAYAQSELGQLGDYSNRQWAGLIDEYYIPRWKLWFTERINELKNVSHEGEFNWFEWEWNWVTTSKNYSKEPKGNILKFAERALCSEE